MNPDDFIDLQEKRLEDMTALTKLISEIDLSSFNKENAAAAFTRMGMLLSIESGILKQSFLSTCETNWDVIINALIDRLKSQSE